MTTSIRMIVLGRLSSPRLKAWHNAVEVAWSDGNVAWYEGRNGEIEACRGRSVDVVENIVVANCASRIDVVEPRQLTPAVDRYDRLILADATTVNVKAVLFGKRDADTP